MSLVPKSAVVWAAPKWMDRARITLLPPSIPRGRRLYAPFNPTRRRRRRHQLPNIAARVIHRLRWKWQITLLYSAGILTLDVKGLTFLWLFVVIGVKKRNGGSRLSIKTHRFFMDLCTRSFFVGSESGSFQNWHWAGSKWSGTAVSRSFFQPGCEHWI